MSERVLLNYRAPATVPPISSPGIYAARLAATLVSWSLVLLITAATALLYIDGNMAIVLAYMVGIPASVALVIVGVLIAPATRRARLLAWWAVPLAVSLALTFLLGYRGAQGAG